MKKRCGWCLSDPREKLKGDKGELMTDVEMLRLASKEEDKAIKMYQGMLADHPHLEGMLLILITEEQKHKKMIEKKISELIRL